MAEEKPELVTSCEVEWVQVKLRGSKNLLVSSFYMPHRNMSDLSELRRSLELVTANKEKHTVIAGDYICPDVDWDCLSVQKEAQDKEVQQAIIDLSVDFNLTQVQDQPTREDNILGLVFTTNQSLIKSISNTPGITDHDILLLTQTPSRSTRSRNPGKVLCFRKPTGNS